MTNLTIRPLILIVFWVVPLISIAQNSNVEASLKRMQTFESQRQIDSIQHFSPIFLEQTEKNATDSKFHAWAKHYYSVVNYYKEQERSLELELEAHDFFVKKKNTLGIIKTAAALGNIYYAVAKDIPMSTKYMELGIEQLNQFGQKELGDSLACGLLAFLNNNLAINKMAEADFEAAMQAASDAAECLGKYQNPNQKAMNLMNFANINARLKQFDKSIQYNHELLALSKELKNVRYISMAINNIASIYGNQNQMDSALVYLKESYALSKQMKDWRGLSLRAANIGFAYTTLKQFERADDYYSEALNLAQKHQLPNREMMVLNFMTKHYLEQKRPNDALNALNNNIENIQKIGKKSELVKAYEMYYEAYDLKNDHKNALDYYKKFKILQDSIESKQVLTNVAELQTKYETAEKDKENLKLRQQGELDKLKIDRRNIAIILSILVLSLFSLAIYLFSNQRRLKAEQRTLVTTQRLRRAQLNPHFFFNALNSIQKLVAVSNHKGEQITYIAKFAKLMRQTLEQSMHEFVELEEEVESLDNYMALQKLRFKNRFDYAIQNDLKDEELYIPAQLAQPFIENSIEHGFKNLDVKGELTIHFSKVADDIIKIEITDNGKGLGQSESSHISRSQEIIRGRLSLFKNDKKYYFTLSNLIENDKIMGVKAVIFAPIQEI